jgi:hypothetical protein
VSVEYCFDGIDCVKLETEKGCFPSADWVMLEHRREELVVVDFIVLLQIK